MENYLNVTDLYYKDVEEYKIDINTTLSCMSSTSERLIFAVVAEKSGITRFVIRKYPELRNYILEKIIYYKEIQVINKKINRAVNNLLKANKSLTFISIINKCRLSSDIIYGNEYVKEKVRSVLVENKHNITTKKNCTRL
ncbi:hypothetical protein [Clostridium sp. DJ247]|uniref:hypothetical protein n=1 Tax=Clostridium sp. DJ247 TaxID=2726188 RepID=UPI001628469B|nr:hypothetical protein [Clostridium sp. DJ247]MBC2580803.1 hypothetical protein [Clostridium sp. DJ247]